MVAHPPGPDAGYDTARCPRGKFSGRAALSGLDLRWKRGDDRELDHSRSLFSAAARRSMVCPTASRPMRVTAP